MLSVLRVVRLRLTTPMKFIRSSTIALRVITSFSPMGLVIFMRGFSSYVKVYSVSVVWVLYGRMQGFVLQRWDG